MSYRIITASGDTNTATLVLSTVDGLEVLETIRVYNTGNNKIDGRRVIATIDAPTKTITFASQSIGTVAAFNPPNASLVPLVTWIDEADVAVFLGYTPAAASVDEEYLLYCSEAANDWAYRRRKEAGYVDSTVAVPSPSVFQGTVLYAGGLFRERGSVDSFASFQDMTITAAPGTMGQIMRLLGINRSQVA
jgi:hypothetical protein